MAKKQQKTIEFHLRTSSNKTVCECNSHSQAVKEKERIESMHGDNSPIMHIVQRKIFITEERL